jgi:hypothetical protein
MKRINPISPEDAGEAIDLSGMTSSSMPNEYRQTFATLPCFPRSRRVLLAALLAGLSASPATFAGNPEPFERLARWAGFGWGDGYQACEFSGKRPGADLPPRTYAEQHQAHRHHHRAQPPWNQIYSVRTNLRRSPATYFAAPPSPSYHESNQEYLSRTVPGEAYPRPPQPAVETNTPSPLPGGSPSVAPNAPTVMRSTAPTPDRVRSRATDTPRSPEMVPFRETRPEAAFPNESLPAPRSGGPDAGAEREQEDELPPPVPTDPFEEALPGEELPGEELPGEELPGEELPGEELPGEELLDAGEWPIGHFPMSPPEGVSSVRSPMELLPPIRRRPYGPGGVVDEDPRAPGQVSENPRRTAGPEPAGSRRESPNTPRISRRWESRVIRQPD